MSKAIMVRRQQHHANEVDRLPVHLYHAHLGVLLGHRFLLVHSGRRTGTRRETVLEVIHYDPVAREAVVAAGWGRKTQWFHNVEAGLAREVGMSTRTVQRIWAEAGLQPHRTETFKFSTDPAFEAKVRDSAGGGATTSGILRAGRHRKGSVESSKVCFGRFGGDTTHFDTYGDTGGYSRFFLVPKASRTEREHGLAVELAAGRRSRTGSGSRLNTHPTVKPVALIAHLLRLVTPPGGLVLDPFVGSGTTAVAAHADGFGCIGIEIDPAYADIASARMRAAVRRDTAKRTG